MHIKHIGTHRVDRVLGFLSSRLNWDLLAPSPAGKCAPRFGSGGGHTGLREKGSQFRRGDRHCGTLGIFVLCAGIRQWLPH